MLMTDLLQFLIPKLAVVIAVTLPVMDILVPFNDEGWTLPRIFAGAVAGLGGIGLWRREMSTAKGKRLSS